MEQRSGKIEVEARGATNTFSPLINSIFNRGENQMTTKTISKICSVEGCDRKTSAKGFCDRHYAAARWKKIRPPSNRYTRTVSERFWDMVEKTDSCWLWTGAAYPYGVFAVNRKCYRAHRFVWFLTYGEFPVMDLLHSCDVPRCVRPDHLRQGTDKDNAHDRDSRGRRQAPKGELNGRSILTWEAVIEARIRFAKGESVACLASEMNISISGMRRAITGKSWTSLI